MKLVRTVVTDKPLGAVFDYLSDFSTTSDWDPGTISTERLRGDGTVGTSYLNTSKFLGRTTRLTYVVEEFIDRRLIRLRGENKTVVAVDTMTFRVAPSGTEVTYTAQFSFKGLSRLVAPLLRPALNRLGDEAAARMTATLDRL